MRSRLFHGCFLVAALTACEGRIAAPPPGGGSGGGSDPGSQIDAGPPPCEPKGAVVPKLLRLSNYEYRNMVADVLGVPVDESLFTRWTPVAVVYGFDTMSETRIDAQAMEEQMHTAEQLAALVLSTPALTAHCPAVRPDVPALCTQKVSYSALDDFSDAQDRDCWSYLDSSGAAMVFDNTQSRWRKQPDQGVYLWRNGAHPGSTVAAVRRWIAPVDGELTLNASFTDVDPGGGDGVAVAISRNGTAIFNRDIANAGAPATFAGPLSVTRGDRIEFVVGPKANPSYDTTAFAAQLSFKATPRKAAWTFANCVEPLVARVASRSFRRPIRSEELADYRALYESNLQQADAAGFAEPVDLALSATLQALFLSPNFVFKPELVPNGLDAKELPYGVASRLALYLRASVPDEPLWMQAGLGELSTPEQIRAAAERLLEKDSARFTLHFGGQWLDYRESPPLGPLTTALQQESRDVFEAVLTEGLAPERLLKPGFTFAAPTLAQYYGLMGTGPRFTTTQRGGVLSHGAFLMRTAQGSDFRRAIHRGLWVLTRLMCRSLPRLEPATLQEITASFNNIDRSLPLPKQMEIHRNNAERCGGCHNQMDPIGLALERYDAQGLWRDRYADGALIETDLQLNGMVVRDPFELANAIESTPQFRACVAEKLLTYALNRGLREDEMCLSQRLGNPLDGSKPNLKELTLDALMWGQSLTEVPP